MNILNQPMEDVRKTSDGNFIQGSCHTCHVLNHKYRNKIIIKSVCALRKISEDFDSIACCGVSGLLVVSQVAELLDKHIVIVRKKDDNCYSKYSTEGVAPFRYIILDDLICSGNTVKHIKRTLKKEYPRSMCVGAYCYLPEETGYSADKEGSKLCEKELGIRLLNIK